MSEVEKEKKRAYYKAYHAANKEKIRAQQRAYKAAHKEEIEAYQKEWRAAHKEELRERYREYQKQWLEGHPHYQKKWREKNPGYFREYLEVKEHKSKSKARVAVNNAIRLGKLTKQPCEVCGEEKAEAHHDDYNEPLEVRWLCKQCHEDWHTKNTPIY